MGRLDLMCYRTSLTKHFMMTGGCWGGNHSDSTRETWLTWSLWGCLGQRDAEDVWAELNDITLDFIRSCGFVRERVFLALSAVKCRSWSYGEGWSSSPAHYLASQIIHSSCSAHLEGKHQCHNSMVGLCGLRWPGWPSTSASVPAVSEVAVDSLCIIPLPHMTDDFLLLLVSYCFWFAILVMVLVTVTSSIHLLIWAVAVCYTAVITLPLWAHSHTYLHICTALKSTKQF